MVCMEIQFIDILQTVVCHCFNFLDELVVGSCRVCHLLKVISDSASLVYTLMQNILLIKLRKPISISLPLEIMLADFDSY